MLTRYYNTASVSPFDIFDHLKIFNDFDKSATRHRADTIDEEGIKIELPGVKQEDVDVTVEGRLIKVTGTNRHGTEFNYSYTLKPSIDEESVTARLEHGLLTIGLPKKKENEPRKIHVST